MVFQFVCLIVPMYRKLQIVLCVILLCDVTWSMILSGAAKKSTGGSGTIDNEGFTVEMARQTRENAKGMYNEKLAELFHLFDNNADGFIDYAEVSDVIKGSVTEEEIHKFIRQWDKDNNSGLDFDEWVKMVENTQ